MTGRNEERDVRHALGYLVSDEPPLGVGVDAVVTQGRRIRRRHRTTRVVMPVAALAAVAVAGGLTLVATDPGTTTEPQLVVAAAAMPLTDAGRATLATERADISTANGKALLDAVRDVTPAGWTYDLAETDIGVPTLDGTVDDGAGTGRLMVSLTNITGMYTVHPCGDSEFRAGASCKETTLADGSYLSVRGLVDYQGIKTYIVSVTRDDGTGVSVEAGNFAIPPQPTAGMTVDKQKDYRPGGKYAPVVTRDEPIYGTPALVTMVKAVARVSADWPTEPMKVR